MTNAKTTKTIQVADLSNDQLTVSVTAFRAYGELESACRGGYVPTLMPRGKGQLARATAELDRRLTADGHRVFRG
jgi:hypothetical protein